MARIVLVLVCGALVFVLVSKFAPHFIETYIPSVASESTTTTAEATESSKAAMTKKKAAAQKAKSGGTASKSSATSAAPSASELPGGAASPAMGLGTPVLPLRTPGQDSRSVARVTAENAPLYLTNTSHGPVVGRLTKGAVVEPLFVVNSAGQNWTFVNAGDQEIAGFLRSETLTKTKSADQSSR